MIVYYCDMRYLILLLPLLSPVHADWAIGGFAKSEHYGAEGVTNESHYGSIYGCYSFACIGKYENSYSTPEDKKYSRFAGYRHLLWTHKGVELEAFAGVAAGS